MQIKVALATDCFLPTGIGDVRGVATAISDAPIRFAIDHDHGDGRARKLDGVGRQRRYDLVDADVRGGAVRRQLDLEFARAIRCRGNLFTRALRKLLGAAAIAFEGDDEALARLVFTSGLPSANISGQCRRGGGGATATGGTTASPLALLPLLLPPLPPPQPTNTTVLDTINKANTFFVRNPYKSSTGWKPCHMCGDIIRCTAILFLLNS